MNFSEQQIAILLLLLGMQAVLIVGSWLAAYSHARRSLPILHNGILAELDSKTLHEAAGCLEVASNIWHRRDMPISANNARRLASELRAMTCRQPLATARQGSLQEVSA